MRAELDMRELAPRVGFTCTIKRFSEWQWRLKLGLLLIRLAAWIMWVNIEIVDESE